MIALDTNILVHAHRPESDFHDKAFAIMRDVAEGNRLTAVPWPCLHEFYCVVTHPRLYTVPTPPDVALSQIDTWIGSPAVALLSESGGYWMRARPIIEAAKVTGPMIYDAKIAGLCLENGIDELWTMDRDFSRFPGLKTRNPLQS